MELLSWLEEGVRSSELQTSGLLEPGRHLLGQIPAGPSEKMAAVVAVVITDPLRAVFLTLSFVIAGWDCVPVLPRQVEHLDGLVREEGFQLEAEVFDFEGASVRIYTSPARVRRPVRGRLMFMTSGSTGGSKLVPFEQEQVVQIVKSLSSVLQYRCDDHVVSAIPVSFDYGFYQVLLAFEARCNIALVRRLAFVADVADLIAELNASIIPVTPAFGSKLARYLLDIGATFPSVRMVTSTGAFFDPTIQNRLRAVFPAAELIAMYGLTECKRIAIRRPGTKYTSLSVGSLVPGVQLRLEPAGSNPGEAVISGPHVARGYWRHDSNRREHQRTLREVGEGTWELWTGDQIRIETDLSLRFEGRIERDFVKLSDEKVSLIEMEASIRRSRLVVDCIAGAEAAADGSLAERIDVFVVPNPGADAESVRSNVRSHVAPRLRELLDIRVVDRLPVTDHGKMRPPSQGDLCGN